MEKSGPCKRLDGPRRGPKPWFRPPPSGAYNSSFLFLNGMVMTVGFFDVSRNLATLAYLHFICPEQLIIGPHIVARSLPVP